MVDFSIVSNNLQNVMTFQRGAAELEWKTDILPQEKGRTFEHTYSGIHYKYYKDEVDDLGVKEDGEEELRTKVQWIAFKSQFFSSVLIAKDPFASSKISELSFKNLTLSTPVLNVDILNKTVANEK